MKNVCDSIIKYFANFDSAGSSGTKIDTLLEFNKLGEYLNGGRVSGYDEYLKLSKSDKNALKEHYNNLENYFTKFISDDNETIKINVDNVSEYTKLVMDLKYEDDEASKFACDKLEKALYQFAKDNGYDFGDLEYNKVDYSFIMGEVKKIIKIKQEREVLAQKTLRNINVPYDNSKLQESVNGYIQKNGVKPLKNTNNEIDLGNGEFDKPATQDTNICWALSSINSLLTTDTGKMLLESNRYYDSTTGVFAIHLQEAEDNNFHGGIYIVTPEDIEAESPNLAHGEGDATAYLIAIKRYFEEVNQNPELADKMELEKHSTKNLNDGNYGFRFFEILTGGQSSLYNSDDSNKPLQKGIGLGIPERCGNYEYVCNIVNDKNGAVTLAIAGHNISVVGVKDGNLLIQESNNDATFSEVFSDSERNHILFNRVEDINGAPAYTLSKDDYENYIGSVSFLKW